MHARDLHEHNRRSWNAAVPIHASHRGDQVAFFRNGGSTLFPEERELLGEIAGQRLLHLMCNAGQDTLSLARLGAEVTGVDLSDAAITAARDLAAATGIPANFQQANMDEWLDTAAKESFDLVYCAYGAFCWIADLTQWTRRVSAVLRPGGRFIAIDFHPLATVLDADWNLSQPYPADGRMLALDGVGDYVGAAQGGLSPAGHTDGVEDFANPHPCYLFLWGLGEIVTALAQAGLRLTLVREYSYVNGERPFNRMRPTTGRRMLPPEDVPEVPLMFGIVAHKPRDAHDEETHGCN